MTIGVDQEAVFGGVQATKSIDVWGMLDAQWPVCVEVQGSPADGGTWTTRMAKALEGGGLPCRGSWQSSLQSGSGAYQESLGNSGENRDLGRTQNLSTPTEEVLLLEALSLCHSF